jgi:transposase-like protein
VDESQEAYEWVFSKFFEATSKEPQLILTDGDVAVEAALATVFPCSTHKWCMWHLQQNLIKHATSVLGPKFKDFMIDFSICRKMQNKQEIVHRL